MPDPTPTPPPPPLLLQSFPTHFSSPFPYPTPPHLTPFSSSTSEISSLLLLLHILKLESQSLHLAHLLHFVTSERDAACHHCQGLLLPSSSFQIQPSSPPNPSASSSSSSTKSNWPPPPPPPPNPLASSSSSTKFAGLLLLH